MPELPDIELYLHALRPRVVGKVLKGVRLASPFLLRSVDPPVEEIAGKRVTDVRRLGKRIVFVLEEDLFIVLHLMIAGRLRWKAASTKIPGKLGLAAFDFDVGTLLLTEASKKKRAALYFCRGEAALRAHDPGGVEPLEIDLGAFRDALTERNHTVKRGLTDPRIFSGIGNAYSDEILHRAKLSPLIWTQRLSEEQLEQLHDATREVLREWIALLQEQNADGFPEKVTAFRPEMPSREV